MYYIFLYIVYICTYFLLRTIKIEQQNKKYSPQSCKNEQIIITRTRRKMLRIFLLARALSGSSPSYISIYLATGKNLNKFGDPEGTRTLGL